ncbi:MAG: hypothetical protein GY867_11810 [bacterium]|nr:hypothetical protein [bacterium]
MKSFQRFAFLTTLATYFLIFMGGLVRVSGAGMGCPDWPKCFGRWIPPLNISQLPPDISPASFNLTLAWIEYFNRVCGMMVGILIVITAVLALIHYRKTPRLLYPTLAAAVLVAFEGWQGSVVVASQLQPFVVTVHMVLSLVIVSLLMYVMQESYHLEHSGGEEESYYPKKVRVWVGLLWLGGILVIILGSQVREAVSGIAEVYPLWSSAQWLSMVGLVSDLHLIVGIVLALFTLFVGFSLLRLSRRPSILVKQAVWGLLILITVQLVLGLVFVAAGMSPILELFHLWIAALFIGLALVLFSAVKRGREALIEEDRRFSLVLALAVVIVVLAGAFGLAVIGQAEMSRNNLPVLGQVPEFDFTERSGGDFDQLDLLGKITVADFIFTRCKAICPTMAVEMKALWELYGHSDLVQFLSIDVDPAHDSLSVMREYLSNLGVNDNRWLFIRGEMEEVRALSEEGFKLSGDFPANHSTRFVLVDPQGRIRGYYEHLDAEDMKRLRQDIQVLARSFQ